MKANTFTKAERISVQKEIDLVFAEGRAFTQYPLRAIYLEQRPLSGVSAAILVSVPKKRFKRAVKRNRIKRWVREAYRLQKHEWLSRLAEQNRGILLAFVYVGKEMCTFAAIEMAVGKTLEQLLHQQTTQTCHAAPPEQIGDGVLNPQSQ